MNELNEEGRVPRHVAVIMDGNGRWAKSRGASRIFGHRNAIKAVRDTTEFCAEKGIEHLTLYAFSTENWARPKYEVDGLMTLLVSTINDELPTLKKNNVRLSSIGDLSKLPREAQEKLASAKSETAGHTGLNLILALNYSGRWSIQQSFCITDRTSVATIIVHSREDAIRQTPRDGNQNQQTESESQKVHR